MGSPTQRSPPKTPLARKPLHDRTNSASNTNKLGGLRLVPYTPPRLSSDLEDYDDNSQPNNVYSRTPLPTLPSHILLPAPATRQGYALEQYERRDDVSAQHHSAKSQAPPGYDVTATHQPPQSGRPTSSSPSEATPQAKPLPKRRKHVALNPDNKTFRVFDVDQKDAGQTSDSRPTSPQSFRSLTSPTFSHASHDRASSNASHGIDSSVRSPSSNLPGSTAASSPMSIGPSSTLALEDDHITSSPWNYKLIGGLRKVPKTPDLKHKALATSDSPLPPLQEISDDPKAISNLSSKASFQSTASTESIISSNPSNYQVYGSSPSQPDPATLPPSSRDSYRQLLVQSSPPDSHCGDSQDAVSETASNPNYQVIGTSSPPPSSQHSDSHIDDTVIITRSESHSDSSDLNYQILGFSSPVSSEIDLGSSNYQLHGGISPSNSQVVLSVAQGQSNYSRESLIVPPLRPRSKRSIERFGYYKQRSRESLRTGSFTSITSVLSQEALRTVLTNGSVTHIPGPSPYSGPVSWANPLALHPARSPMQAHPHQWSSQLSTVPSESDGGTDRGSRSFSDSSNGASNGANRRSSGFPSMHSRQMPSISSSLVQEENQSVISELEYPQPTFPRGGQRDATGSTMRVVEDQDEYGDGLTDMPDLRQRTSRNRLSDFYSVASDNERTNTMRSTSSSRANSLLANAIPTWARLYYGSGERRYLGVTGSMSEISSMSRASSRRSGSPDDANFPSILHSPRRRPRNINPNARRPESGDSLRISPLPQLGSDGRLIHGHYRPRFRTSSIWSPHLGIDRRADARRKSVWDGAPSFNLSTESGIFGKRNRQLVMFIAGFIIPICRSSHAL
jgi:hypothetical protein